MLRRLQARSAAASAVIKVAEAEKRQANYRRSTSLAWRDLPQAVPEGKPFGKRSRSTSDLDALRAHVHANRERYHADLEEERARAVGRVAAATSADWVPSSVEAWTALLADREDYFIGLLANATVARRSRSHRLEAAHRVPQPALRIQPQPQPPGAVIRTPLDKLLRGLSGWFFVASADGLRFLFIASHAGRTFVVDSRPFVVGEGKAIRVGPTFFAQTHLQPLEALTLPSTGKVFEARIAA
jgi:hypothetical protein